MSVDARVLTLLLRWEEAQAQGQSLTPEQLCAESPELLDAVKAHIQDLESLSLAQSTEDHADGPNSVAYPDLPNSEVQPVAWADPAAAVGRYRTLSFHAKGGLGEVWRAEDEHLHREVALKRI